MAAAKDILEQRITKLGTGSIIIISNNKHTMTTLTDTTHCKTHSGSSEATSTLTTLSIDLVT